MMVWGAGRRGCFSKSHESNDTGESINREHRCTMWYPIGQMFNRAPAESGLVPWTKLIDPSLSILAYRSELINSSVVQLVEGTEDLEGRRDIAVVLFGT